MVTTKSYDYLNRLQAISAAPQASGSALIGASYAYNAINQRTRLTAPDGSFWAFGYDALGQVTGGVKYWPDNTPVPGEPFGHTFDTIGNRTATTVGGNQAGGNLRSATYTANALNEYLSRTVPNVVDVLGQATASSSVTVNSVAVDYRRGQFFDRRLPVSNASTPVWQSVTVASGTASQTGHIYVPPATENFTSDLDGNLSTDSRWTYSWDGENRLVTMITSSAAVTAGAPNQKLVFTYDDQSRRIEKQVYTWSGSALTLSSTIRFLYDGWSLIAEVDASGNLIRSYLWGNDLSGSLQGAGGVGGMIYVKPGGSAAQFACYDGNGNVIGLVDGVAGTLSALYEYESNGEIIRNIGNLAVVNPCRFSTKYYDDETALAYFGFRFYNPILGRWISRDPLGNFDATKIATGGQEHNLYGFCSATPINLFDHLGLAFYAIDGSAANESSQANPWQLYNATREVPKRYWPGPSAEFGATGSDTYAIAVNVFNRISWDYCDEKEAGNDLTINLTGWSRGAMIATLVAKWLNNGGIDCLKCGEWKSYRPVKVNWIGLFDAVARTYNDPGWPTEVRRTSRISITQLKLIHLTYFLLGRFPVRLSLDLTIIAVRNRVTVIL